VIEPHVAEIRRRAEALGRPAKLMEVCGTHTMAAFRCGLRSLLPERVALSSGPGCPVCVTPISFIDRAIAIARLPGTLVATFGDMLRVPGSEATLERARAEGAALQVVYSPADALALARREPEREVVFLGVGFETTAPTVAWTIREAHLSGVANYSVLCAHKTMPQAMSALVRSGELGIDGFLCPGHVTTIIGPEAYEFLAREHGVPCVVAGFEPADIAAGIAMLLAQLAGGRAEVQVQYDRAVLPGGNPAAQAVIDEVFEPSDAEWRGLGVIPGSGLAIRPAFAGQDAERRYGALDVPAPRPRKGCICGAVLRGAKTPRDCPLFGDACTPGDPWGPCMVSSEGTCSAWYRYARHDAARPVEGDRP
jgi:hydrogenase expression/formation protein HypD